MKAWKSLFVWSSSGPGGQEIETVSLQSHTSCSYLSRVARLEWPRSSVPRPQFPLPGGGGVGGVMAKFVALVAVPAAFCTLIGPVEDPARTVAVMWVSLVTTKLARIPLKRTIVVPVKFVPTMVTESPSTPEVGEKLVIVGGF
jgi:hypothetical protein